MITGETIFIAPNERKWLESENTSLQSHMKKGGIIMSIAERAYNSRVGNKTNKTETAEQRTYRLSNMSNNVLHAIEKVDSAQDFIRVRNSISMFSHEAGKGDYRVQMLNKKLSDRMDVLTTETAEQIDQLNGEIEELKRTQYNESADVLKALREQSDRKMLDIMLSLGTNKNDSNINKRKIGNFVHDADRAQAVALARLCIMPDYAELFTAKQKEVILEKAKTQEEKEFEQNKEESLKEKNAKLAKLYMKRFHIKNAVKQISNTGYYFKKGE